MTPTRLVCYSRATRPITRCERAALAAACRERNVERGLTGGLVLYRDVFLQVVEGPAEAVTSLFGRLLRDPRHAGITLVALDPVDLPALPVWLAELDEPEIVEDLLARENAPPPFDPSRLDGAAITRIVREACLARTFLVD